MISIRVFKAVNEPHTCVEYIKGHVKVLRDYGIENVTSNNDIWTSNPNMYCFIATNSENELIGGIRIQVADGINNLPVEDAIGKMDPEIFKLIDFLNRNGGVGELCGLWNSNEVKGMGVSVILVRAAISAINQLKFQTMTGICAGYSLKMFQNVGFVINKSLGKNGDFIYPTEDYLAHVVGILNGMTLDTAVDFDKERMLNLRSKPVQLCVETGPKGDFIVNYNLLLEAFNENIHSELALIYEDVI
jgi:hypothetical protein